MKPIRPRLSRRPRAREGLLRRLVGSLALLVVVVVSTAAQAVEVRLEDRSPDAAYEVWLTTSLDLTAPGQPVGWALFPSDSDVVRIDLPSEAHWIFLHERFQPEGGPPLDLFLPYSLLPQPRSAEPITLSSVDPTVLMTRTRFSTDPSVLARLAFVFLLVFGGGFGMRRLLRDSASRPGRRCAPLESTPSTPASARARQAFLALLAAIVVLRLPGFFGESLDLLEVSYLPGIGRPAPFAEGASGFGLVAGLVRELVALYCLDLTHPPLYHAVLGVFGLFGSNEWLLRLPALGASIASAWLIWQLGRRWSEQVGLAGVALFAVAAPSIYFGQDATPYAFVGTVALGASWALLRALETGLPGYWRWFFGLLVAGFLCHYNVAPFGLALVALLLWWVVRGGTREWRAALHLGLGEALKLAVFPVAWTWLHFSTFPTVAQDTRLVADTYMPDPGWFTYLLDFTKVTAGIRADGPVWALAGALPLLLLGLHAALRDEDRARRLLGQLLLVLGATFVVSTLFFYENARTHLGGRIFWGFRWVGWYHPVLLGCLGLGLVHGAGPKGLRGVLLAVWLGGAVPTTVQHLTEPSRPDYAGAAELILAELEDGDALATLPAWFQRGNLAYYLFDTGRLKRAPQYGEGAWTVEEKRLTIESVHAGLPFETTARNAHADRLWVAVVNETMFGRDKFNPEVAANAVAWADQHMMFEREWVLDRLTLRRYRRKPGDLEASSTIPLDASRVPLMARTYPPLEGALAFARPASVPEMHWLGPTLGYQAPMTPPCLDYAPDGMPDGLRPEAPLHWYLDLRVPGAEPEVEGVGSTWVTREGVEGGTRVVAAGPPCDTPDKPLRLDLHAK
ncbi:MAG: glycosyltransferase family 39 protein [Deltaproteobacteria bacterium]|nr:glycosyltransferase family 39 protein [Deltaproteobacteria bacterium]